MTPLAPTTAAGLVDREVTTGTRDGVPTRSIIARRVYATEPADLWEAVTDRERLPRWFLPISGELHVGGRFQLEGNAGGTIEACDPPRSFAATWEYAEQMSWVRVRLSAADAGTLLELEHEAPIADGVFWEQYGPGAGGIGWDLGLLGLALHLDVDGEQVDAAAAEAWPTSPDGVAFVQRAAESWADAAIADGDDPEAARAAAERTVEFYTVPPT